MLYLAIDQHRKQLTVNLRNEAGDVILTPVFYSWRGGFVASRYLMDEMRVWGRIHGATE